MPERGESLPPPCPAARSPPAGPGPLSTSSGPAAFPTDRSRPAGRRQAPSRQTPHPHESPPGRPKHSNRSKAEEATTSLKSNRAQELPSPSAPARRTRATEQPPRPRNQQDRSPPAGRRFRSPGARCQTHFPCEGAGRSRRTGVGRDTNNSPLKPTLRPLRSTSRRALRPRGRCPLSHRARTPPPPSRPSSGSRTPPAHSGSLAAPAATPPQPNGLRAPAAPLSSPPLRCAPSPSSSPRQPGRRPPSRAPQPPARLTPPNTASSPPGHPPRSLPRRPPRRPPASPRPALTGRSGLSRGRRPARSGPDPPCGFGVCFVYVPS